MLKTIQHKLKVLEIIALTDREEKKRIMGRCRPSVGSGRNQDKTCSIHSRVVGSLHACTFIQDSLKIFVLLRTLIKQVIITLSSNFSCLLRLVKHTVEMFL